MIKEFAEGTYKYFLDCLDYFHKGYYRQAIEESLIYDETIYKLGFMKHPLCTVKIEIHDNDIEEILRNATNLRENDFEKYNHYLEFFNIIKTLRH